MEKNNIKETEIIDIPQVKKSKFENFEIWYDKKGKTIFRTIASGAIASTAIAGTLITASMAFSIGLLPTLAVTSCYVAATMMSSYIFKEEVNKLKGNIVFNDEEEKNITKTEKKEKEKENDKESDNGSHHDKKINQEDKEKEKEELDIPPVKEELDISMVKESIFKKISKPIAEKISKKKETKSDKEELDIPMVKESIFKKITKPITKKLNKKKEEQKNNKKVKKLNLDIFKPKKLKLNSLKNIFNKVKSKKKKRKKSKKLSSSKFIKILSIISYIMVALTALITTVIVLPAGILLKSVPTMLIGAGSALVTLTSLRKIYKKIVSIVKLNEELSYDEELDLEKLDSEEELELGESKSSVKNLNINSEQDILKAELVEEDKLGDFKPKKEINNPKETVPFDLDDVIDVPEDEIVLVEENPKVLKLSK